MNRAKVLLTRPEPELEQALKAHKLETLLPVILAAVVIIALTVPALARMVLR